MAKPNPPKNPPKSDTAHTEHVSPELGKEVPENVAAKSSIPNEPSPKPAPNPPAANLGKKDAVVNRNKKGPTGVAKGPSLMPSQHKLENLKAAVAAAGSVDNLLLILHHVDEAGGRQEVAESVEAYRALKLALE
jgi:hypothetical protein